MACSPHANEDAAFTTNENRQPLITVNKDYALFRAVQWNDLEEVKKLIANGANVNAPGMCAFMWAIEEEQIETIKTFIEAGVDVNAEAWFGPVLLRAAGSCRNSEVIKLLLDAGAEPNAFINNHNYTLIYIIQNGSPNPQVWSHYYGTLPSREAIRAENGKIVQVLVDAGIDVNIQYYPKIMTPLSYAADHSNFEVFKILLAAGADWPEIMDESKKFDFLTFNPYLYLNDEMMDELRAIAANLSNQNVDDWLFKLTELFDEKQKSLSQQYEKIFNESGVADQNLYENALHGYIHRKDNKRIKSLIQDSKGYNHNNPMGTKALEAAITQGNLEVVKLLLDAGVRVNAKVKPGKTILMHAVTDGTPEIVRLLINEGANVNAYDGTGNNAAMMAAHNHNEYFPNVQNAIAVENIKNLLAAGCRVNKWASDGSTLLSYAAMFIRPDIIRVLVNSDAYLDDRSGPFDRTPLMLAVSHTPKDLGGRWGATTPKEKIIFHRLRNRFESVKLLLAAGANAHAVDKNGKTARDLAIEEGHGEIVLLIDSFLEHSTLPETGFHFSSQAQDNEAWLYTVRWGNPEQIKAMIAAGADVDAKDPNSSIGSTALMDFARKGEFGENLGTAFNF